MESTSSEASDLALARQVVIDRLTALDVSRKTERDKRKEESEAKVNPEESIAAFLSEFHAQHVSVSSALDALRLAGAEGPGAEQLPGRLDELADQVLQMERSSANASYFLPSYDLKQCMSSAADLKQSIDTARTNLVPKRKFAFSRKVTRVKGSELSSAAGTGTSTAADAMAGGTAVSGSASSREASGGPTGAGAEGSGAACARSEGQPRSAPSPQDIALVQQGRGLMGVRGQVLVLTPEQVAGHDFVLIDLQDCHVYLLGHLPALRLLCLKNTTVVAGPITGACFADGVEGCTIVVASYQVRIHNTTNADFYLRTRSKPIIEHSSNVRFAPMALAASEANPGNARDEEFQQLLQKHKLGEANDLFTQVEDFGWIKAVQSPNWSVLPEAMRMPAVQIPWERANCPSTGQQQPVGREDEI